MFLQKRFSIYACFLHIFIVSLFVFFGNNSTEAEEDDIVKKVIEIDVFKPASSAIMAETISDEDLVNKILANEDITQTYTQKEKIALEEKKEFERANKAKKAQEKKQRAKEIAKEKERIKRENEKVKAKLENDRKKLQEEKEKLQRKIRERELAKKERMERERKIREEKLQQKIKEEKRKKELEENRKKELEESRKIVKKEVKQKTLSKTEWLETDSGKRDYALYSNELYSKVYGRWIKPFHAKSGWGCTLVINQDNKGRVKNIKDVKCNPDNKELKNSVQRAVNQASPLPLPKDPRLFDNTIIFKFSVE